MRRTIARPISVTGVGLHLGVPVTLEFLPGPSGSGIVFRRRDLANAQPIPALASQAVLTERRTGVAAELPADLVTIYTKLRERLGGIGAGELVGKRCMGCRMELNPADLSTIAAAPPDAVLRCEECGRILVRTSNSAV